ncbi:glycerol kinase GlpK [Aliiglaciecola sp. LCG003]|uniref:glycerol kinase GlpK n=1 Tax=Aliiglaciecola sp. LCG003 TaxID=3053655 RepID=UPI0025737A11|nr:glycerol kinase GlpK [Aliiglaciecola sp. LCG003]WJG08738.1 glycerol kinase GlpK [Aliiglaciecola sp. LCG003]
MNMDNCILAIDQGTTSSRAIVFNAASEIVCSAQQEFIQHYPNDGWVEHDPEEIWQSTLAVCKKALQQANEKGAQVLGIGVTNQRETTLVWERKTGKTIYNAIVWQDRRTAAACKTLIDAGQLQHVRDKTGLLLDPYFSASKIAWILEHVEGARQKAKAGELAFGTIDSFIIWRLTGGKVHATDITNASRTNLFNIHQQHWDEELLTLFDVPESMLPTVKECADDYGMTESTLFGEALPICGVAGDQQAAAIGQCCFTKGSIKSTYGTGCFVLVNTGEEAFESEHKLLTTVAYKINGTTHYALEGSIFIAGAAIQWLRDGIKVIDNAFQTEPLATSLDYEHGVYLVPAFAGLGAPYWDPDARGAIYGLTRGTTNAHLSRAALESVAFQTSDLLNAMAEDGVTPKVLRVDGGMVANNWVCQFIADVLNIEVQRPSIMETTALGAAYLAGLHLGIYPSLESLKDSNKIDAEFKPQMQDSVRQKLLSGWKSAVQSTLGFKR